MHIHITHACTYICVCRYATFYLLAFFSFLWVGLSLYSRNRALSDSDPVTEEEATEETMLGQNCAETYDQVAWVPPLKEH